MLKWIQGHLLLLGVVAFAALFVAALLYVIGAEKAKADAERYKARIEGAELAARESAAENEKCLKLNADNAAAAAEERRRAAVAAAQIRALRAAVDAMEEDINAEAETMRQSGLDCPAIDDDFRRWMFNGSARTHLHNPDG